MPIFLSTGGIFFDSTPTQVGLTHIGKIMKILPFKIESLNTCDCLLKEFISFQTLF